MPEREGRRSLQVHLPALQVPRRPGNVPAVQSGVSGLFGEGDICRAGRLSLVRGGEIPERFVGRIGKTIDILTDCLIIWILISLVDWLIDWLNSC